MGGFILPYDARALKKAPWPTLFLYPCEVPSPNVVYISEGLTERGGIPSEDSQIIQLYWERDQQAIDATLQNIAGSFCTAIAKNILGNDQDAEECVNDAYLSVWNAIPPHRPGILPAFLAKITRNTALNKYKHNTAQKRGGGQLPLVLDELSDLVSGKEEQWRQAFDRQELLQAIQDFLASLLPSKAEYFPLPLLVHRQRGRHSGPLRHEGGRRSHDPQPPAPQTAPLSFRKGFCIMTNEDFYKILSDVDERYVAAARRPQTVKSRACGASGAPRLPACAPFWQADGFCIIPIPRR